MKNLFKLMLFCLLLTGVGCSGSDDSGGIIVGGPTNPDPTDPDPTDPVDNGGPEAGGNEVIEGFTYDPSEILKDVTNFPMGNIVSASKLSSGSADNTTFKAILNEEYNSITAENDMKPSSMFGGPDPADYNYTAADAIVAYAQENNLRVHGHVLAWHSQQPGWFSSFAGTDEEFETAVMNYITATVAHFAEAKLPSGESVVASWDVLNETFEDENNLLYTKIDDVRAKVFQAARAGDPDVLLFYNDFNVAGDATKRAKILAMVDDFKARDIPIDGLGMQMHLNHNWPDTDLPIAIQEISDTGLLVHISELDVKVNYNGPNDFTLTEELAADQEAQYQRAAFYYNDIVPAAQQYGITLWGFRDQDSWLYGGGSDYPAIYDNDFNYKVSHRGLVNGLNGVNAQ